MVCRYVFMLWCDNMYSVDCRGSDGVVETWKTVRMGSKQHVLYLHNIMYVNCAVFNMTFFRVILMQVVCRNVHS